MRYSRFFAGAAALLITAGLALAQTPPPSPAPPTGGVDVVPPDDSPLQTKTFESPFNGERRTSDPEGQDYTKLQDAYDFWQDMIAAVEKAKACGSYADYQHALELEARAHSEFNGLLNQYVIDWSQFSYGQKKPPTGKFGSQHMDDQYDGDKAKVVAELQSHYVPFGKPVCPKPDAPMTPPDGGVKSGPHKADDGGLGGLLGHVTIGVDVGGGKKHGHDSSDDHHSSSGDHPSDSDSDRPHD